MLTLQVKYLLKPPASSGQVSRPGAATAILVIHYLLLIPMAICFFRLVSTIVINPGFVPLGPRRHSNDMRSGRGSKKGDWTDRQSHMQEKENGTDRQSHSQGSRSGNQIDENGWPMLTDPPPGLERHYKYDVFVCESGGRPIWCQYCRNWKPDRAHHCRELNRCILKMDHYCPWSVIFLKSSSRHTDTFRVGGMVSEYSFKWFIQFTSYASIFCIFLVISIATFTAERAKEVRSSLIESRRGSFAWWRLHVEWMARMWPRLVAVLV
jgi:palmitoyltransferase